MGPWGAKDARDEGSSRVMTRVPGGWRSKRLESKIDYSILIKEYKKIF